MMDALGLFWSAILVGALTSMTLSLYGVHFATRDKALQSMALSQGAQLGVLLSLGIPSLTISPWLGGFVFSTLIAFSSEKIAEKVNASKNTVFIVFFLALLATSYCLISIFPLLDSHHSQAFFGDLVYLAGTELLLAAIVSSITLLLLLKNSKRWAYQSFSVATFGKDFLIQKKYERLFFWSGLVLIVTSVFSIGLMLTLSALFIPSLVMSFTQKASLRKHLISCAIIGAISVIIGFVITLQVGDYPTVPIIVLALILLSLATLFITDSLRKAP